MATTIKLLGTLEIHEDGTPSRLLQSSKGCALVSYLIITGQAQPREVVADLLFESSSTSQSLRNLRSLLNRIRPLAPFLQITLKTLSLQPSPDMRVDFDSLRAVLNSPEHSEKAEGLPLYRGDLLASFYLPDAPRFMEWLAIVREKLRLQVIGAHRELCTFYAERGAWDDGIKIAQHWVAIDDLDEEAYRWLMQMLASGGQLSAALKQYERCRQRLWQELGIEPDPTTTALAEQLSQQQAARDPRFFQSTGDPAYAFQPEPGVLSPPGALPPQSYLPFHRNAIFTGRAADLIRLAEALLPTHDTDGLTKAAVVTGMGGLGKTQLAVEYAYRYGRYYPGGVYWLNFAKAESIGEEIAAIGGEHRLGRFNEGDRLSLSQKLERIQQAWQEPTPRLLIFDNCESVDLAAKWLPVTGGCSVILTSRHGRWPKALPLTRLPLATLPRMESIPFLQQLAAELTGDKANQIAEEVGDLPLALHLAGSFLAQQQGQVSADTYLAQLREAHSLHHASLQGQQAPYSPTGHEVNVARTFAVSMEPLDPANPVDSLATHLLIRAACFAPNEPIPLRLLSFPIHDAREQDESRSDFKDGLARLLSLGLLGSPNEETAVIHPLLAQYVHHDLGMETAEIQRALEEHLIAQIKAHRAQDVTLITLPVSALHLRFIVDRALLREDCTAVGLANLFGAHLLSIGHFEDAHRYIQPVLTLAVRECGPESLQAAEAHSNMGELFYELGKYRQAEPHYAQALAIYRVWFEPDHPEIARMLNNMGIIRAKIGPYESARPFWEQALAIRQKVLGPEHPETLGSLNNLGAMYNFMGKHEEARHYFGKVLAIRERTLGTDHLLTATSLNNLGDLLNRMGDPDAGRPLLERALSIRIRQLGADHPLTLACETNLGELLRASGDLVQSEYHLQHALKVAESKLGDQHPLTGRILNSLGVLFTDMDQLAEAELALNRALAIRETTRGLAHPDTAYTLICLGELHEKMGQPETAVVHFQRALTILEQSVEPSHAGLRRVQAHLQRMPDAH